MMLFPLLAGAGALALLLAGGKKKSPEKSPDSIEDVDTLDDDDLEIDDNSGDIKVAPAEKKKALTETIEAAATKDWPKAIANALASGSKKVVDALVKRLEKEGKKTQAKDLAKAFAEMQKLAKKSSSKKSSSKKSSSKKSSSKKADDKKKRDAEAKKKRDAEAKKKRDAEAKKKRDAEAKKKRDAEAKKKRDAAKPKALPAPKISDAQKRAEKMKAMLLSSSRYKEDKGLVEDVQADLATSQDGKYGPGTARLLYDNYGMVPSNPYYWPASNTAAKVSEYKNWLAGIRSVVDSTKKAEIDRYLSTVGR